MMLRATYRVTIWTDDREEPFNHYICQATDVTDQGVYMNVNSVDGSSDSYRHQRVIRFTVNPWPLKEFPDDPDCRQ